MPQESDNTLAKLLKERGLHPQAGEHYNLKPPAPVDVTFLATKHFKIQLDTKRIQGALSHSMASSIVVRSSHEYQARRAELTQQQHAKLETTLQTLKTRVDEEGACPQNLLPSPHANDLVQQKGCGSCQQQGSRRCSSCDGLGQKDCTSCGTKGRTACSSCGGRGQVNCGCFSGQQNCSRCGGTGAQYVWRTNYNQFTQQNYQEHVRESCSCQFGKVTCTNCSGRGTRGCSLCASQGEKTCTSCSGQGRNICSACSGARRITCSYCAGTGSIYYGEKVSTCLVITDATNSMQCDSDYQDEIAKAFSDHVEDADNFPILALERNGGEWRMDCEFSPSQIFLIEGRFKEQQHIVVIDEAQENILHGGEFVEAIAYDQVGSRIEQLESELENIEIHERRGIRAAIKALENSSFGAWLMRGESTSSSETKLFESAKATENIMTITNRVSNIVQKDRKETTGAISDAVLLFLLAAQATIFYTEVFTNLIAHAAVFFANMVIATLIGTLLEKGRIKLLAPSLKLNGRQTRGITGWSISYARLIIGASMTILAPLAVYWAMGNPPIFDTHYFSGGLPEIVIKPATTSG